jgi:membrane protein implicated in regulation of membrane protease activity
MTNSINWLLILAVLIFIEIITLGLSTIWFAVGALVAFIISLFFDNLILEIILFLIISLALLYFTRPLVLKYIHPKHAKINYEGVIGKNAEVLITIDNISQTGKVNVEGQEWSARSYEGSIIEKGSTVRIQSITGAKLLVSKL